MASWTADELDRIGRAEELQISSERPDGTFRPFVIIWAVRVGDDIYVRSAHGIDNPWYRRALVTHLGRISSGGVEREVSFADAGPEIEQAIDAAYHAKYVGDNAQYVPSVVGEDSHAATLRLTPR
jgi:hypothetical protein